MFPVFMKNTLALAQQHHHDPDFFMLASSSCQHSKHSGCIVFAMHVPCIIKKHLGQAT
jgi:hypothetical protein